MRFSLATSGLLDPRQLDAWTQERQRAIRTAVKRGFTTSGREVAEKARAHMRSVFEVKRPSFVKSLRARVLDRDASRLPALLVGSRIPWLGIHETGGRVSGNLLIPLLPIRIGPKRFRQVIDGLLRSGNAFFVKKNGKTLLMAENIKENAPQLRRFARAERSRTGVKRLQRGQEIPIAVLVKSVTVRKRLDLAGVVRANLRRIARAVQTELDR
ncbi:MAG: DUF6441 family protein [Candidatus Rokuibacteriota bacterium]